MSDCVAKERTSRVRLFVLDACGAMGAIASVTVLDVTQFETISWAENITAGTRVTTTNTSGTVCRDRTSPPSDLGQTVSLNECVASWSLAAALGFGTPAVVTAVLKGLDRTALNPNARVAMEILFSLDALCTGGTAQCIGRLYPMLTEAAITGTQTIDGKTAAKASYTLNTKVNAHLFDNYATPGTPTGEMAHWAPFSAAITAGNAFYHERIFNCPTLTGVQGCELRALA